MSFVNFILAFFAWIFIYTFIKSLNERVMIRQFYGHSENSLKAFDSFNTSSKSLNVIRSAMYDVLENSAPEKYKLSFLEKVAKTLNPLRYNRTTIEQIIVINHFLEINAQEFKKISFNVYQVTSFLNNMNVTINRYLEKNGLTLTQSEKVYWLYCLFLHMGKRYKLNESEIFLLKPLYQETFNGLTKPPKEVIETLTSQLLGSTNYGEVRKKYAIAMGIKTLIFYIPAFNTYKTVKDLKTATSFYTH